MPGYAVVLETDQIGGIPYIERGISADQMVNIDAKTGYLVTKDGVVLWSRGAQERRAIASITKVMTAIIAIEEDRLDDEVMISPYASIIGGSTANFEAGQVYTMRYLLDAMLLVSGNDAAIAIAEHIGGDDASITEFEVPPSGEFDTPAFTILMNKKAHEMGLENSHFTNPQGFDAEEHYSSAEDVAKMVTYAMKKPLFREIVSTTQFDVPGAEPRPSTNILLTTFEGANGVKTGMTDAAGECLAGSALRGDIELYGIVLGAASDEERFQECADLLSFGFDHYANRILAESGTVLGSTEVTNYLDVEIEVGITHDVAATYYDLLGPIEQKVHIEPIKAPVTNDTIVGSIKFLQNGEVIATEPIYSFEEIERPTFFESIQISLTRMWRWMTGSGGDKQLVTTD
ncbi:MAG: D-alanyl-D-alanine carboxypeptidase [Actinomycetia bacterium]|nr:D-alanyl-D-alanine carboxypeptidase [Actinomycetes bacterium]